MRETQIQRETHKHTWERLIRYKGIHTLTGRQTHIYTERDTHIVRHPLTHTQTRKNMNFERDTEREREAQIE